MSVANAESRHKDYASGQISFVNDCLKACLRILESQNGSVENVSWSFIDLAMEDGPGVERIGPKYGIYLPSVEIIDIAYVS